MKTTRKLLNRAAMIVAVWFILFQLVRFIMTDHRQVEFNQCVEAMGGHTDSVCEECFNLIYNN